VPRSAVDELFDPARPSSRALAAEDAVLEEH
jgi:hypothetical protein